MNVQSAIFPSVSQAMVPWPGAETAAQRDVQRVRILDQTVCKHGTVSRRFYPHAKALGPHILLLAVEHGSGKFVAWAQHWYQTAVASPEAWLSAWYAAARRACVLGKHDALQALLEHGLPPYHPMAHGARLLELLVWSPGGDASLRWAMVELLLAHGVMRAASEKTCTLLRWCQGPMGPKTPADKVSIIGSALAMPPSTANVPAQRTRRVQLNTLPALPAPTRPRCRLTRFAVTLVAAVVPAKHAPPLSTDWEKTPDIFKVASHH